MFNISIDEKEIDEIEVIEAECGNPNIEVMYAKIKLYKDRKKMESFDTLLDNGLPKDRRGEKVLILGVPGFITTSDLCVFMTDQFLQKVKKMKIFKGKDRSQYMALIDFGTQLWADQFYLKFNGTSFNSLESYRCVICFVESVEFQNESLNPSVFSDQVEFPTCSFCLEKLDSDVSGIVTKLCQHDFHVDCLKQWKNSDNSCPVCRYNASNETDAFCSTCGRQDDLWICLTCGHLACGRYSSGHAKEHFIESGHTFCLELDTQRVWDYAGDAFVHRLISSKLGYDMVDVSKKEDDVEFYEAQMNSKMDSLAEEYNKLLADQLNKQRVYFESEISSLCQAREMERNKFTSKISEMESNQKILQSKANKALERVKEIEKEKSLLQQLNKHLAENQKKYQIEIQKIKEQHKSELQKKNLELVQLSEINSDLMNHLGTQEKLQQKGASGGDMFVLKGVSNPIKRNRRRK